jgi:hypothetical protein
VTPILIASVSAKKRSGDMRLRLATRSTARAPELI